MSTIALFIRPDAIKANTYVDENVDEKALSVAIERAQYRNIRPIIGSGIYNELNTQITAGTLTALNTTLLTDYIQPAMEYWTLRELVFPMLYKFQNKNIAKKNSDNSNPIELDEAIQLRNEFKNQAEELTDSLKLYLVENSTDYPLYLNPGNGVDTVHPSGKAFTTTWYLGNLERNEGESDCEHYCP